jgi:hypothetical protein
MRRTIRLMVMAAVLLAAAPAGALAAGGRAGLAALQAAPAALADFNGDGIDDLVVGVPGEDIGGTANAGVVDIIYGSESGLAEGTREQLTQALPEAGDQFGAAVVTGDILTDLAVGVPGENIGAIADAGRSRSSTAAAAAGRPAVPTSSFARGPAAWPARPRPATGSATP